MAAAPCARALRPSLDRLVDSWGDAIERCVSPLALECVPYFDLKEMYAYYPGEGYWYKGQLYQELYACDEEYTGDRWW